VAETKNLLWPNVQEKHSHRRASRMKHSFFRILKLIVFTSFLNGCGRPVYTDVTSLPGYNFSSFAHTVWKTKIKLALVDVKRYTGKHELALVSSSGFDSMDPKYRPLPYSQTIAILPVGTRLSIERLMKDNRIGDLNVVVRLETEAHSGRTIYILPELLEKNRFIWEGKSSSTNWGVNPDMLERSE
jgi:hypothetical protein